MREFSNELNKHEKESYGYTMVQEKDNQDSSFEDNSPEAIQMRQFQSSIDRSNEAQQLMSFDQAVQENEMMQLDKYQTPVENNHTEIPDTLKTGMENLSGVSLDDVNVHRNSNKPEKLDAHAYAEGEDVYLASGQDKYLPHELGHVVQQKKGRVKPTIQKKGKHNINDDSSLEKEADLMGEKALQTQTDAPSKKKIVEHKSNSNAVQRQVIEEEDADMESLYEVTGSKRQFKFRSSSPFIYSANEAGVIRNPIGNEELETKKLSEKTKFNKVNVENKDEKLPKGNFILIKYIVPANNKNGWKYSYGYANENEVQPMGEYKDISEIGANKKNPKQGKILPDLQKDDPDISQKDVYQSSISDCYLHAALMSIVSSNPDKIRQLFTINDDSVTVKFKGYKDSYKTHDPVTVKMNKKLFLTPKGEPLYGGKKNSYLWPAFIQKAWAIYKGKYSKTAMQTPLEIMSMITGTNTSVNRINFPVEGEENVARSWTLYDEVVDALKSNKAVTLSTKKWMDKKGMMKKREVIPSKKDHGGLGILHVYSVQGIGNTSLKPSEKEEVPNTTIELRDPRTKSGKTFKLPFKKVLDDEKIAYLAFEGKEEE